MQPTTFTADSSGAAPVVPLDDKAAAALLVESYNRIAAEMGKFIVGQTEVIEQLMIAVLAGGHCLLEGVPGLAKTAMIRTLSETLSMAFRRIQFTPDLMPSDITGTDIIQEDPETGRRFRDEIVAVGGSRPAMDSFRAFRGREPTVDALLRHNGMTEAVAAA